MAEVGVRRASTVYQQQYGLSSAAWRRVSMLAEVEHACRREVPGARAYAGLP